MAYYTPHAYPHTISCTAAGEMGRGNTLRFHNAPPGYGNGIYYVVESEHRHHGRRRREVEAEMLKVVEENRKLVEKLADAKKEVEALKAEKVALGVELEEARERERGREGEAWNAWVRGE